MALADYDLQNTNRVRFDSVYKTKAALTPNTYLETTVIIYGRIKIIVESTYLNDSVAPGQSNLFNPVCLKQELKFYEGNRLSKTFTPPVLRIRQRVANMDSIDMLEDVMTDVGLIKGDKGILVVVTGWGGCDSCTEFYGLLTLAGTPLWYVYQSKYKVYKQIGSFQKLAEEYQIDQQEFSRQKYSKVGIY